MNVLLKPIVLAWCALRHPLLRRRYRRLVLEQIDGVPLLVLPEVFNPVLLRTGAFLARTLQGLADLGAGSRVLDMGTGSGVGAVFAARRGARVVAVDINPEAVRCTSLNALLNRLEDRIEVRQGDLFAPLTPEKGAGFDLVLFNPPFYRGEPRDNLDHAWCGIDVFERFASGLGQVLAPGGRVLLVLSTDGEPGAATSALREQGFTVQKLVSHEFVNEVITAFECRLQKSDARSTSHDDMTCGVERSYDPAL
jgi:HemK-related putative methylase